MTVTHEWLMFFRESLTGSAGWRDRAGCQLNAKELVTQAERIADLAMEVLAEREAAASARVGRPQDFFPSLSPTKLVDAEHLTTSAPSDLDELVGADVAARDR